MRRQRGYSDGQIARVHAGVALVVCTVMLGVVLLLCGCGVQKRATRSHTASITQGVEVRVDSTYHPYRYKLNRYFLPSGALEREELEGEGVESQLSVYFRDTLYITERDTITEIIEKPTYSTSVGGNSNWYWWLLSGVALSVLTYLVLKLKRG